MILSEDKNFTGASWIDYSTSTTFTFKNSINEVKIVYCKVRDATWNESRIKYDTITLDTVDPEVEARTLTSPNGGESWSGGSNQKITWGGITDANLKENPIKLEYSTDSGSSFNTISENVENDGEYLWTVPNIDSTKVRVKLTAYDLAGNEASDVSDADFEIQAAPPPQKLKLPKTGQTRKFAAGDDGDLQMGLAWPVPRFTHIGDGTIKDNLTGLVWTQDGNLMVTRDPSFDMDDAAGDGMVTWQHALDYVAKLNKEAYLGYTDWRLPNVVELRSIIHAGVTDTAEWLEEEGLANVESGFYWTSTTYASDPDWSWKLFLGDGTTFPSEKSGVPSKMGYVWAVRNGE
jgi:hypothetical protein